MFIVSAQTFHQMRQAQRETIASADLTDDEMASIEETKMIAPSTGFSQSNE